MANETETCSNSVYDEMVACRPAFFEYVRGLRIKVNEEMDAVRKSIGKELVNGK